LPDEEHDADVASASRRGPLRNSGKSVPRRPNPIPQKIWATVKGAGLLAEA
jgi:hypothetical protein